jgi:hypothetical protein
MNYLQGKGGERPEMETDALVAKLLTAAAAGDVKKVKEALDDGANVNGAVRPPMRTTTSPTRCTTFEHSSHMGVRCCFLFPRTTTSEPRCTWLPPRASWRC